MNTNKNYWFYLDSFVHVSIKGRVVVLYNPYTGKLLEYKDREKCLKLVRRLMAPGNMWVIKLSENDLQDPDIDAFVTDVREYFMGDLLDVQYSSTKPMQMVPHVKIQKDVELISKEPERAVGEGIMSYLSEVFIYLNSSCTHRCRMCEYAYLQFPCCTARPDRNTELPLRLLETLLEACAYSTLNDINLLGGDLLQYSQWEHLTELLDTSPAKKLFWLHYLNTAPKLNGLERMLQIKNIKNSCVKMPVSFPLQTDKLKTTLEWMRCREIPVIPVLIIGDDSEFEQAEALLSTIWDGNVEYVPIYRSGSSVDGEGLSNIDFFKDNFFISQQDIQQSKPDLKSIYMSQYVNTADFGKVTVMPDGEVYANINNPPLGRLGKDALADMLVKELKGRKSWRLTRSNVNPCKNCAYLNLCPPITNYNRAIGQYDMCFIKDRQ
jgi:pseudo-rSAM protein